MGRRCSPKLQGEQNLDMAASPKEFSGTVSEAFVCDCIAD